MLKLFASYALARLREPSTWNGAVIAAAGSYHLAVSITTAQAIAAAGAMLAGTISTIAKERGATWL